MNALVLALALLPGGASPAPFDCTDALPRVFGPELSTVSRTCTVVACPPALQPHLGTWRGTRETTRWDAPAERAPHELRYRFCVVADDDPTVYLYGHEGRTAGASWPVARSEAERLPGDTPTWGTNTPGCEPPNLYRERTERLVKTRRGPALDVEVRQSLRSTDEVKRVIERARLYRVAP